MSVGRRAWFGSQPGTCIRQGAGLGLRAWEHDPGKRLRAPSPCGALRLPVSPPARFSLLPPLPQSLDKWGYMCIGLAAGLPVLVLPAVLSPRADADKPLTQRYWFKANVWIAIFSFIGNYAWTHYFYDVLGAAYTFPAHELNGVRPCPGGEGLGACQAEERCGWLGPRQRCGTGS